MFVSTLTWLSHKMWREKCENVHLNWFCYMLSIWCHEQYWSLSNTVICIVPHFNILVAFQPCDYNYIRKQCMIDFWLHSSSNTLRWCEHNPEKVCKGINGLSLSTHQGSTLRPVGSPMRPAFTQCTLKLPWLLWVQMTE